MVEGHIHQDDIVSSGRQLELVEIRLAEPDVDDSLRLRRLARLVERNRRRVQGDHRRDEMQLRDEDLHSGRAATEAQPAGRLRYPEPLDQPDQPVDVG